MSCCREFLHVSVKYMVEGAGRPEAAEKVATAGEGETRDERGGSDRLRPSAGRRSKGLVRLCCGAWAWPGLAQAPPALRLSIKIKARLRLVSGASAALRPLSPASRLSSASTSAALGAALQVGSRLGTATAGAPFRDPRRHLHLHLPLLPSGRPWKPTMCRTCTLQVHMSSIYLTSLSLGYHPPPRSLSRPPAPGKRDVQGSPGISSCARHGSAG